MSYWPSDAPPIWPVPGRRVPRVYDMFLSPRAWAVEAQVSRDARRALMLTVGAIALAWLVGTSTAALLWWEAFDAFSKQNQFVYYGRSILSQTAAMTVVVAGTAWWKPERWGLVDGPWLDQVLRPWPHAAAPGQPMIVTAPLRPASPSAQLLDRAGIPADPSVPAPADEAPLPRFDTLKTLG